MVALTWGQLFALIVPAAAWFGAIGWYFGRLTRTAPDGTERLVFPVPGINHAGPRRRWSDEHEGWR